MIKFIEDEDAILVELECDKCKAEGDVWPKLAGYLPEHRSALFESDGWVDVLPDGWSVDNMDGTYCADCTTAEAEDEEALDSVTSDDVQPLVSELEKVAEKLNKKTKKRKKAE